jgi:hypothetical protein
VAVSVTKTLVGGEAQARALGFVSSPTIRIDGVDIAGELVESACDSCSVRLPEVAGADRWRAAYCRHRPGILDQTRRPAS